MFTASILYGLVVLALSALFWVFGSSVKTLLGGMADRIETRLDGRKARQRERRISEGRERALAEFHQLWNAPENVEARRRIVREIELEDEQDEIERMVNWCGDHGTHNGREAA